MIRNIFILLSFFVYNSIFAQTVVTLEQLDKNIKIEKNSVIDLKVKVRIADGWHINSHKPNEDYLIPAKFGIVERNDVKLISVDYPKKAVKEIKLSISEIPFSVFEGEFIINTKLKFLEDFDFSKDVISYLEYQACNNSTCLAPDKIELRLTFNLDKKNFSDTDTSLVKDSKSEITEKDTDNNQQLIFSSKEKFNLTENKQQQESKSDSGLFDENNLMLSLLLIFLAGLGLNLTPCVYPLIMITVGFFGAQSESKTSKLFLLSLTYVIGISIMYSLFGVIAAMTGGIFGSALQNPIVILILVAILVAMALSMFGLYEIQPPASLMNKIGSAKSGYVGSLIMGLTMGIAAAPCVGPVIISLLTVVGKLGNVFLGFLIFFVLSFGLGLPYLFLGMFSGKIKSLPRSGEWMIGVKIIFGIIILAIAIHFLNPLIGEPYSNYTIPIFLIQASMYLAFLNKAGESSKVFKVVKYIFVILAFNISVFSLIPGEQKAINDNWIKPDKIDFLEKGKPVILDFYADWCIPCKELDKFTFSDQRVIEKLKGFNKYKLDLTKADNELAIELTKKYDIKGVPTIILMDANLKEVERINGFINAEDLIKIIELKKIL